MGTVLEEGDLLLGLLGVVAKEIRVRNLFGGVAGYEVVDCSLEEKGGVAACFLEFIF